MRGESLGWAFFFACCAGVASEGGSFPVGGTACQLFWFAAAFVFWVALLSLFSFLDRFLDRQEKFGEKTD